MANKLHTDSRQTFYDYIGFVDYAKDSGDLITGTPTITATSEPASADYSFAGTFVKPTMNGVAMSFAEVGWEIKRIATRLQVTIDSDDGTHDLRCRVYVDTKDSDHLLYDLSFTTTGAQVAVQPCHAVTKPVIFNALTDGAGHTFYFFFWSPGNHSPVLSLAQVTWGIGNSGTTSYTVLRTTNKGMGSLRIRTDASTMGTANYTRWQTPYSTTGYYDLTGAGGSASSVYNYLSVSAIPHIGDAMISLTAQTATDIFTLGALVLCLIREE